MSIRNLEHFFRPQSVTVIGASEKPRSVGATVLHNLIEVKFAGAIMPVNPKYRQLAGLKVYPSVANLPTVPELAVICTPPATVPSLIGELGACGTKAAIVITAGACCNLYLIYPVALGLGLSDVNAPAIVIDEISVPGLVRCSHCKCRGPGSQRSQTDLSPKITASRARTSTALGR